MASSYVVSGFLGLKSFCRYLSLKAILTLNTSLKLRVKIGDSEDSPYEDPSNQSQIETKSRVTSDPGDRGVSPLPHPLTVGDWTPLYRVYKISELDRSLFTLSYFSTCMSAYYRRLWILSLVWLLEGTE